MTVAELIDMLGDFPEHAEVRLMMQPNYPFEYSVDGLYDPTDGEDTGGTFTPNEAKRPVVYLTEGRQIGYGTKAAWEGR